MPVIATSLSRPRPLLDVADRVGPGALQLFGALLASLTILHFRECTIDDAYISLRHARHFLQGQGLVYNPGEYVEGYTNLGFVLWVSAWGWLGFDLVAVAKVSGVMGAIAAVWLAPLAPWPDARKGRWERAAARTLCLANFAFMYLACTGMETAAFTGVVSGLACAASRSNFRATWMVGFLAWAAFLIRPEGALVGLICLGLCGAYGGRSRLMRSAGAWIFLIGVVAVELWRYGYYGALTPNTALVKGALSGVKEGYAPWYSTFGHEVVEALSQTGGMVMGWLALLAVARHSDRRRAVLAAGVCAGVLAFQFYAGEDWMVGYRYLQPMVPLYLTLAVIGAVEAFRALYPRVESFTGGAAVMGVVVTAIGCWGFGVDFHREIRAYPHFIMTSRDMIDAARWLGERYPPHYQITCWRIGALGYYSNLTVIDTLGLTDEYLARHGADSPQGQAYLHQRRPELAILKGRPGEPAAPTKQLHGHAYRFVRDFPQGKHETWVLYELQDLARDEEHPSP